MPSLNDGNSPENPLPATSDAKLENQSSIKSGWFYDPETRQGVLTLGSIDQALFLSIVNLANAIAYQGMILRLTSVQSSEEALRDALKGMEAYKA